MINIETWFPTFIGQEILEDHEKIAKKIVPICKKIQGKIKNTENNWVSKLYQTCHTHNICGNKKFDYINKIIYQKVHEYIAAIGGKEIINFAEGWFNVYKKYDFQEFHCHPSRQISVIYVLKSTKEDPKIIFERNEGLYNQESDIDTKALSTKVRYNSVQGNLLIFRSSLHHCVEMKQDDSERISLAYNFNLKKQ
jgi:uncharacterized protein (TIGR02466 family)|tara:strand:- start:570 stop:1154 length:585 start_codon:yes stop_codon:yes gene_type:complete